MLRHESAKLLFVGLNLTSPYTTTPQTILATSLPKQSLTNRNNLNYTVEKTRNMHKFQSVKFIPNNGNNDGHGFMSGSPNLPVVVQQQPFVFKCLHKKDLHSQVDQNNYPSSLRQPILET